MPVTHPVAKLIAEQQSIEAIREEASCFGYKTMQEHALERIREGKTSVEEAKRLIAFDTIERRDRRTSLFKAA